MIRQQNLVLCTSPSTYAFVLIGLLGCTYVNWTLTSSIKTKRLHKRRRNIARLFVCLFRFIVFTLIDPTVSHDSMPLLVCHTVVFGSHVMIFFCTMAVIVTMSKIVLCIWITKVSCNFKEVDSCTLVLLAL